MRNRASACALFFTLVAVPAFAQAPPAPSADTRARAAAGLGLQRRGLRACAADDQTGQDQRASPSRRGRPGSCHPGPVRPWRHPGRQRRRECRAAAWAAIFRASRHTAGDRSQDRRRSRRFTPSGWVQILGVDTMVSTALVIHACEAIMFDDYLEPFVAPDHCRASPARHDAAV